MSTVGKLKYAGKGQIVRETDGALVSPRAVVQAYNDLLEMADNFRKTLKCAHVDTQWKCPYALGIMSPMREGDQCCRKAYGDCRLLAAKLAALKRTLSIVKREIKKLEAEAED